MTNVRTMNATDIDAAVAMHLSVLEAEFLSRFGPRFMHRYYLAWGEAPGGISLVAVDADERVVGVLLGASDPRGHLRAMVRQHGWAMGSRMALYAVVHPRLARDLVATRGRRYAGGLWRLAKARLFRRANTPESANAEAPRVGEITHLMVASTTQGSGVGRALVDEAVVRARTAHVGELELVTPPDFAARHFYERLGWRLEGSLRSRSGEEFVRYRFTID